MAAYKSWTGFGIREGANDCGLWMKFGSSSSEGSKYSDSDLAASVIINCITLLFTKLVNFDR
jgi:hypothetical protein